MTMKKALPAKSFYIYVLLIFGMSCSPKIANQEYKQLQYENQQLQQRLSMANNKLEKVLHDNNPKNIKRDSFNVQKYRILQAKYDQLFVRYRKATFRTKGVSDCNHLEQKIRTLQNQFDSLANVIQNMHRLKVSDKE